MPTTCSDGVPPVPHDVRERVLSLAVRSIRCGDSPIGAKRWREALDTLAAYSRHWCLYEPSRRVVAIERIDRVFGPDEYWDGWRVDGRCQPLDEICSV